MLKSHAPLPAAFRTDAVALVRSSGGSISVAAADLGSAAESLRPGARLSRTRVVRRMRVARLRGCTARRKVRMTVHDPAATPAPNLVQRQFDAGERDCVWGTDITYLPTAAG